MSTKKLIGLYGGAFDPIHNAHIEIAKRCIDEINLNKIKKISKEAYTENIKNNMIKYVKTNNNINIKYDIWLKQFNKEDYIQEFEDKTRDNEIYHER